MKVGPIYRFGDFLMRKSGDEVLNCMNLLYL